MGYGGAEDFDSRAEADERIDEITEDWGDDPPEHGTTLTRRYVTSYQTPADPEGNQ